MNLSPTTCVTDDPEEAAAYIQNGDLAAFPTETVYGLGADATSDDAVQKVFDAKKRPSNNPLIVHLPDIDDITEVMAPVPSEAHQLLARFAPGPITVIGPNRGDISSVATCGLHTVAVRIPSDPVATAFLEACRVPVAAPSANISGRPSPTTWETVERDLGGRIDCILKGGRTAVGLESTVVDCSTSPPVLLRNGAIPLEELRAAIPSISEHSPAREPSRSPGTRYRHYAPSATVHLVAPAEITDTEGAAYIGLTPPEEGDFKLIRICPSTERYAYELYHFFREADLAGCTSIFCEKVPPQRIGRALLDRIQRASKAT